MKLQKHPALAAAGLSALCWSGWMGPLLNPRHHWIYHDHGPLGSIFLPILINVVLSWVLFWFLLWLATTSNRAKIVIWSGVILLSPFLLLNDVALLNIWIVPRGLCKAVFVLSGLCWIAVNAFWRPSFIPVFARVQAFSRHMLTVTAAFGLLVFCQACWVFHGSRSLELHRPLRPLADSISEAKRPQKVRVIWIILDELSYQQVYERRFPSLDLPAFDQLASQATVFTHASPAAGWTEMAVPSLMTGLPVDHISAGTDGTLQLLHNPVAKQWQPFDPENTVFQDAVSEGFHTGIAGWYNPYCRILGKVLDRCAWIFREGYAGGMYSSNSSSANLWASWRSMLAPFMLRHTEKNDAGTLAHIADYSDIVVAGDEILRDSHLDFLLLHVPVPHPGGIYDRRTGTFTTHRSSYIDNLALADKYLAHVRQLLEARGEWDSSAVVVMGDHSWRTAQLYRGSTAWTPEDEAASHGGEFDDRPAYIVKLPNQKEGARIDSTFPAVRTRALLDGILDGRIRTAPELKAFAVQTPNPGTPPRLVAIQAEAAAPGCRVLLAGKAPRPPGCGPRAGAGPRP